ncbi:MAG: cbb3-type cytochrome c oxidase subunit II [Nitrospirae bacterium]|nr:cbb3-type cytochrome c oxidase subunit II [Nitrospirota bacterium]
MKHNVAILVLFAALLTAVPPLWADPDKGRALYEEKGCTNCHAINGEGGAVGPDLSTEGDRKDRDRAWHIAHLLDPASVVPGSIMPQLVFDEDEAGHLADYLMSLTAATAPTALLAPVQPEG